MVTSHLEHCVGVALEDHDLAADINELMGWIDGDDSISSPRGKFKFSDEIFYVYRIYKETKNYRKSTAAHCSTCRKMYAGVWERKKAYSPEKTKMQYLKHLGWQP